LRQFNRNETIRRIEIGLSAFVDHANKIVFSGSFVWQNLVDLVKLKRCRIVGVI